MSTFFSNLFTSTVSVLSGWQGYAALAAVCLALGGFTGWRIESWHAGASQSATFQRENKIILQAGNVTNQISLQFTPILIHDVTHKQQVIDEVHTHVTPETDRSFPVPCGFVRVFNDAWHGPVPDPAACPDGAASTVESSAVGDAEAVNGGNYDLVSHQLTALQDWIRQQQALSEKQ